MSANLASPAVRKALESLAADVSALEARFAKASDGMRRLLHQLEPDKANAGDVATLRKVLPVVQGCLLAANGFVVQMKEMK